jgi:hypothetical protein
VSLQERREQLRRALREVWPKAPTLAEIEQLPLYGHKPPRSVVLGDLLQLLASGRARLVPCSLPVRWEAL